MAAPATREEVQSADKVSSYTIYIDEAGRGACVGPLVYGALVVRQDAVELDALWSRLPVKAKRARDSKAMTERARDIYFQAMLNSSIHVASESICQTYETFCKKAAFMTYSTSAQDITQALLLDHNECARQGKSSHVNLNTMSYTATAQLILCATRWIGDSDAPSLAIVADRLGHDAASHEDGVRSALRALDPGRRLLWTEFRSEPRADDTYKGVSIASIAAKVTRDRAVGHDVAGHGYPNPACSKWMIEHVRHPDPRIRYSWDNVQRILPQLDMSNDLQRQYTLLHRTVSA